MTRADQIFRERGERGKDALTAEVNVHSPGTVTFSFQMLISFFTLHAATGTRVRRTAVVHLHIITAPRFRPT